MFHPLSVISILALLSTAPLVHAQQLSLQPPAGLSAATYSSSAVEVFWIRTEGAVEYTVSRGNDLLELIDGTSFFEEGLEPNTTYQYEIRSVDADGNESEASLITVSTRGGIPETDARRPLSLRADVYSSTALELFWRREFGGAVTYEVARDGVVVGTSNGSSFFDDELTPGTAYEYTITLLGSNSPPSTITSTTNGSSRGPMVDGPLLENARFVVYSDTAAELLWDRPAPEFGVDRVEVLRGTGNVATDSLGRFDATSYFDNSREPGVAYSYSLIARDRGGNELDRVNFSADDAQIPGSVEFVSPILGEFNETEIVNLVFSAFSGQAFGNDVLRLPYHSDPAYSSINLLGGAPAGAVVADIVCDNGGTAIFEPVQFADSNDSGWNFNFDNCLDGTEIIDGELTRQISNAAMVESMRGISIDGSARQAQYSGLMLRTFDTPRDGRTNAELAYRDLSGENLNVVYTENGDTFELVNANFRYVLALPFSASVEGSFQVRSTLTQNRLLDVVIIDPFAWTGSANTPLSAANWVAFDYGSMIITAEDGTELQVDADADNFGDFIRINAFPSERGGNTFFPWTNFSESLPLFIPGF